MHFNFFLTCAFLATLRFSLVVEAAGLSALGSIYDCSIPSSSTKISGFKGDVFYYPWSSYDTESNIGSQNQDLYTTDGYLDGGYVGSGR